MLRSGERLPRVQLMKADSELGGCAGDEPEDVERLLQNPVDTGNLLAATEHGQRTLRAGQIIVTEPTGRPDGRQTTPPSPPSGSSRRGRAAAVTRLAAVLTGGRSAPVLQTLNWVDHPL